MYVLYILECEDKTLYTGITTDITRRFVQHKNGLGGNYTRAKKADHIVYTEEFPDRSNALKREAAIKKLSRAQKLALIATSDGVM